jgi:hypothetical protein
MEPVSGRFTITLMNLIFASYTKEILLKSTMKNTFAAIDLSRYYLVVKLVVVDDVEAP